MITHILIDGHVHVHPSYDEETFLTSAHRNLAALGDGFPALLLTEISGTNAFAKWKSGDCAWSASPTEEDFSLVLGDRLLAVAGRQVVTAEGVEVLAQFTTKDFPDGRPLDETIDRILEANALATLPWGFGKWIGRRGRDVARMIDRYSIALGDNAGRPPFWPAPSLFQRRVTLPGTDPLRLQSQQTLAGTYGFALSGQFDLRYPGSQILNALRHCEKIKPLGRRVSVTGFFRQQIGLRISA